MASTVALENMHKLLLEALRYREQEIIRYLAILAPALGGFFWLLFNRSGNMVIFTSGTIGVQLLLFLGAVYSLALGYNYRYITLALAKLEALLEIKNAIPCGWPTQPKDFRKRYKYCTPPEVIQIFWLAFLVGIFGVTVTACTYTPNNPLWLLVVTACEWCIVMSFLLPLHFGKKLLKICKKEPKQWGSIKILKPLEVEESKEHLPITS